MSGYVSEYGYRRIPVHAPGYSRDRRLVFEHVLVWESAHGKIPKGKEIHHLNGDKLDNRLENLKLVSRLEHKRIHEGCELREDIWWKPCRRCMEKKPIDQFYQKQDGCMPICKACQIQLAVFYKRRRRAEGASPRGGRGRVLCRKWHPEDEPRNPVTEKT